MNDEIAIPSAPALTDLAGRINAEHEKCLSAARAAISHALEAGRLLIEAKAQLGHGEWIPWMQENCRFSERTAQAYMRVVRRLPELEAKTQRVADLPPVPVAFFMTQRWISAITMTPARESLFISSRTGTRAESSLSRPLRRSSANGLACQ